MQSASDLTVCSTATAEYYGWGEGCEGWHLVKTPDLSIIQECMPSGTAEQLHYHARAQQFFYVLTGTATFEIAGQEVTVTGGQGLHIAPHVPHRILNQTQDSLTFTVTSQPMAHGDRVNLPLTA